ncbi:polysaccharide pyruvyl transferase family protein [Sinomicrobium soli]|uniref:polysaccharide pyruvyl transferase family protein n=1 Tax=Sinomicrobium sp. N-1-3-6 TaxID=2219864 RepID=UPI000DCD2C48|nr:polysaccharide pyruvyl transferase family protein [Sinomicrobium sp. N-1-3-6]RAV29405.1 hypothetical protein DN748_07825 [Sinomicrobium sp. N-1-3-6]
MNILVVGAHFYNKGAHLMMKTVIDEFRNKEEYTLYLSPCSGTKEQIEGLGYKIMDFPLKHVTAYRSFNIFFFFGNILKYLKKEYRGTLPFDDIDAVLDISGFAFSDQWGDQAVLNVHRLINKIKAKGKKYIFLPQAFGPFSSRIIRKYMREGVSKADLVMARDNNSFEMLKELDRKSEILKYPDITIGLKPGKTEFDQENFACIVPNERMLDQGREYWPEGEYMKYVKKSIKKILSGTDCNILVLVHDKGAGDMKLGREIVDDFPENNRISLFYEEDPVKLKSIIGQASFVIGSRYHALVSALSQNIPCISLGWSHKYIMLFEEYNTEEYVFEIPDDEKFDEKVNFICSLSKREEIIDRLKSANLELIVKNEEMWQLVYEKLNA